MGVGLALTVHAVSTTVLVTVISFPTATLYTHHAFLEI